MVARSDLSAPVQGTQSQTSFTPVVSYPTVNIGIVIPTLNEEKNIQEVICRLKDLGFYNVLVIDGKSKDHTKKVAAENGAKVVVQTGRGKGNAIRQVLNNNYLDVDVLVLMDADGSMDPDEIPSFIEALSSGADIAKGSRFLKSAYTHDMTAFRKFGNKLMMFAVNTLWPNANYTDLCYGYAVFNKRAINRLAPELVSEHFEIEAEIFIKALNMGLVVKEVPSVEYERKHGTSNLNAFKDGSKIFKTIFKEFFKL